MESFKTETSHSVMRMKRVRMLMMMIIINMLQTELIISLGSLLDVCVIAYHTNIQHWQVTVHYNYMLDDCPLWYSQVQFWTKMGAIILVVLTRRLRDHLIVNSIVQLSHCGVWIDHKYNFIKETESNLCCKRKYHSICLSLPSFPDVLVLMMICICIFIWICICICLLYTSDAADE